MHTIVEEFKKAATAVIQEFKKEISGVRAGRPSTALLEEIKVNYYGTPTPLKHMGNVSVMPPRELIVQLWDKEAVQPAARRSRAHRSGSPRMWKGIPYAFFFRS